MLNILGCFFKNKAKPIDKAMIESACEKVSAQLNDLLKTHNIQIILKASDCDTQLEEGEAKWPQDNRNLNWEGSINSFDQKNQSFTIGIFANNTLQALCNSEVIVTKWGTPQLCISFIERASNEENPLKGLVIKSFSEVNRKIALSSDIQQLGVIAPFPEIIENYKAAGYKYRFWNKQPWANNLTSFSFIK